MLEMGKERTMVAAATSCSGMGGLSRLQALYRLYYNGAPTPEGLRARRRRSRPQTEAGSAFSAVPGAVAAGASDMPFDDSDRALVARVKEGDSTAFATLHRRYYRKLYRFVYLRTNNTEDAADITSETFCRALQRLQNY